MKPPYHRFSFWIHCASALCGYVTLILTSLAGLQFASISDPVTSLARMYADIWDYLPLLAGLAPIAIACSAPATWVCLGIASRLKLVSYRGFAGVSLVASVVTTVCLVMAVSPPQFSLLIETVLRNGIAAGTSLMGGYLAVLFMIALCMTPASVVAAIVYRRLAVCECFWRGEPG